MTARADLVPFIRPIYLLRRQPSSRAKAAYIAEPLGGQLGAELTATARNAFAQSLEVVAAIGAVMLLIMAIAAVVLLQRVAPGPAAGESDLSAAA